VSLLLLSFAAVDRAAAESLLQVDLPTNDIVYDPVSDMLYASVPSSAGFPRGNSITPIDPHTGAIGTSVFAGSEPGQLALADDGSLLYVALGPTNRVGRFNVPTQTMGADFEMGPANYRVQDMEVVPGHPEALAIARRHTSGSPYNQGAAIFVDGEMLPTATGMASCDLITFSDSADVLYGHMSGISPHTTLLTLDVDLNPADGGVRITKTTGGLVSGDIQYDDGRVYTSRGHVVDPVNHSPLGSFAGIPFGGRAFVPDSANDKTFFVYGGKINIFHQPTFLAMGEIDVPGFGGDGKQLVRFGTDGLAFNTDDTVYILRNAAVPEPSTLVLLAAGGFAFGAYFVRRRKRA